MDPSRDDNGWDKHKLYVTSKLEDNAQELKLLNTKVDKVNAMCTDIKIKLAALQVRSSLKAGVIGALTVGIPNLFAVLWFLAKGG